MITDEELTELRTGNLKTMVSLDKRGLFIGGRESLLEYAERLQRLRENIAAMESSLADTGIYSVDDLTLKAGSRIDKTRFEEAQAVTRPHYAFSINWVPGFYINPRMGWLFGGCAFYFFPDFFAVFILRRTFAKRKRWLIYNRTELLAHELCHVARIALKSQIYEEYFAYQISNSSFRRAVGGTFRGAGDSLLLLGSTFLLLGAQLSHFLLWPALPIWPFWGLVILVVAFIFGRGKLTQQRIMRARRNLEQAGYEATDSILFRATDEEIDQLASCTAADTVKPLLKEWQKQFPRWQVIIERFG
ncbi:MAG: hypothetical protein R6V56_01635 [Lentisphaeria bacterium]